MNQISPIISIVTVVFNGKATLEKTILSVLNQNYNNFEYIIIDGGSTDGTLDIIHRYENQITYWSSQPDKGVYDAMNKSIRFCQGNFIFFLGADDILLPDILSEISPFLVSINTIYYGNVFMTVRGKTYDGYFSSWKLAIRNICHQSIFYPAHVFKEYQYNLQLKIMADYELNLKLYGNKNFKFKYINKLISLYQDSGLSATNFDKDFDDLKPTLIKNNFNGGIYLYFKLRRFISKKLKVISHKSPQDE